jgi:hypothetical protein
LAHWAPSAEGQPVSWQALPMKPALQLQLPATHAPWPAHSQAAPAAPPGHAAEAATGQPARLQSASDQPAAHAQRPVAVLQAPWPEHVAPVEFVGQRCSAHE